MHRGLIIPFPPSPNLLFEELQTLLIEDLNKFTLEILVAVPGTSSHRLMWSEVVQHVELGRGGGRREEVKVAYTSKRYATNGKMRKDATKKIRGKSLEVPLEQL